tara:strand:- start:128 stop:412 length:285 start_codon:yes stop_codon:yes gene_type:complete
MKITRYKIAKNNCNFCVFSKNNINGIEKKSKRKLFFFKFFIDEIKKILNETKFNKLPRLEDLNKIEFISNTSELKYKLSSAYFNGSFKLIRLLK